jgi:hypothetical protein
LLEDEKLLKKITGLDYEQIFNVAEIIATSKISFVLSPISLTLLLLFHLRQYTVTAVTSWLFEIPKSTFDNIIWKLIHCLYSNYITKFAFPPLSERLAQGTMFYSYTVVGAGDGVEQACVMSVDKNKAKLTRSGKKQMHTLTKFVLISVRGICWYFTKSHLGAYNDMNVATLQSTLHDISGLTSEEAFVFDSGYEGLERVWKNTSVLIPFKYATEVWQKNWNALLVALRLVSENFFAEIKKFKILQLRFRAKGDLDKLKAKHHEVWVCCAGLMQEFIHPNGLRNNSWRLEPIIE